MNTRVKIIYRIIFSSIIFFLFSANLSAMKRGRDDEDNINTKRKKNKEVILYNTDAEFAIKIVYETGCLDAESIYILNGVNKYLQYLVQNRPNFDKKHPFSINMLKKYSFVIRGGEEIQLGELSSKNKCSIIFKNEDQNNDPVIESENLTLLNGNFLLQYVTHIHLESFDIYEIRFVCEFISANNESLKNLKFLDIIDCGLDSKSLGHLATFLPHLKTLSIIERDSNYAPVEVDEGFCGLLTKCTKLKELTISLYTDDTLSNDDLEDIGMLTSLRELNLDGIIFENDNLKSFSNLTNLTTLDLGAYTLENSNSDNGMEGLEQLTNLKELSLALFKIEDNLINIRGLTNLTMLNLGNSIIGASENGMKSIGELTNLKELNFIAQNVEVDTNLCLHQLRNLKIETEGTDITVSMSEEIAKESESN
jgi:hypothetical protein